MRTTPLTPEQSAALQAAVGENFTVRVFSSFQERLSVAGLLWDNAYIRLTCPEAFPVHYGIIEWNVRYSVDRIPDQATGADPMTVKIMPWAMKSWERMNFLNRYMGATIAPRIQMDFLPGIACAAHLLLIAKEKPDGLAAYLQAGAALQRLWLTATRVGLHLQPVGDVGHAHQRLAGAADVGDHRSAAGGGGTHGRLGGADHRTRRSRGRRRGGGAYRHPGRGDGHS